MAISQAEMFFCCWRQCFGSCYFLFVYSLSAKHVQTMTGNLFILYFASERDQTPCGRLQLLSLLNMQTEVGNVPYVVENGCGEFSKSPREISKIVAEWFGSKSAELRAMSQNCVKLARPDAVFKIVRDLNELVRQRNFSPQYSCASP